MKPIETHYKGYRFRSRAVFFDALGVTWDYELEGYVLPDSTRYLPDFWLPQVRMWAEVKPKFTPEEIGKCKGLAKLTGCSCLLLEGVPTNKPYVAVEPADEQDFRQDYPGEAEYCLTNSHGYVTDESRFYSSPGSAEEGMFDDTETAAAAARAARFEHGETPDAGG